MVNQFDGQTYPEYCRGHESTLEAVTAVLPGLATVSPAQLASYGGAKQHALHRIACGNQC